MRRKLPSRSALTLSSFASRPVASYGAVTVNATRRRGAKALAGGTQTNPIAAPTESPTDPS